MTRTWFERRHKEEMKDPEYAAAYREAKAEIDAVDALVRELDAERTRQGLTKAALAKRSGLPAESVRRLFTIDEPDPKMSTVMRLSVSLGRPLGLPPVKPKGRGQARVIGLVSGRQRAKAAVRKRASRRGRHAARVSS
jgi:DNA-binding phage protein